MFRLVVILTFIIHPPSFLQPFSMLVICLLLFQPLYMSIVALQSNYMLIKIYMLFSITELHHYYNFFSHMQLLLLVQLIWTFMYITSHYNPTTIWLKDFYFASNWRVPSYIVTNYKLHTKTTMKLPILWLRCTTLIAREQNVF
jgi:hypothetical protein